MNPEFDAVVVSDLHLGARNARHGDFLEFLNWVRTPLLILAGDIFDRPNLDRFTPDDVRVFDTLRAFGTENRVVWLRGNHDPSLEWFWAVLGLTAHDETTLEIGSQTYMVCHGHEWDASIALPWLIVEGADAVYRFAQRLDRSHQLARRLKRGSKRFCRTVDKLRQSAVEEARGRGLAGVILGHTHVASETWVDGVHYLNCGCWTERPSGFVGVRGNRVRRYFWEPLARRSTRRQSTVVAATNSILPALPQPT